MIPSAAIEKYMSAFGNFAQFLIQIFYNIEKNYEHMMFLVFYYCFSLC